MKAEKLVKMANEIASFFEVEPDRALVLESIAGHLKRFWDPRMRREILEHVDQRAGDGLKETVIAAIEAHRSTLIPTKDRGAREPAPSGS